MEKEIYELAQMAMDARKYAYTPYSHFSVGAALLTMTGRVYTGCNIENAAYSPTNCAERTAFFKAISEGEREFAGIAIAGGKEGRIPESFCAPCGVCRQVMMEFCDPKTFIIILIKGKGDQDRDFKTYTLNQLMPEGFGPNNLKDD